MKILWLSWKDRTNPLAGGAEVLTDALCSRAVAAGHEVVLLTAGYPGCERESVYNGYKIIRVGGRWSVYVLAARYYRQHLRGWSDVLVEEINTIPFFTQWYAHKENRYLFFHQLCREIWFYQMIFPLSLLGYLLEPLYLWLLRRNRVVTVSSSTLNDLLRFGFAKRRMHIISEGILLDPTPLSDIKKFALPTLLSLGSLRAMKRTLHQVEAFEYAKTELPDLRLIVVGGPHERYGQKVIQKMEASKYADAIDYRGWVSETEKQELMQRSHLIAVTSVKEGWGMIVTEANSQGTPAIVYDVDGLRDSAKLGEINVLVKENTPSALAREIVSLLKDQNRYKQMQKAGHAAAQRITFEQAFADFSLAVNLENR